MRKFRYISSMERKGPSSDAQAKLFAAGLPDTRDPGVVYTRPWVVNLVLDLAGYDSGENLVDSVGVEPSCGSGEFLEPMIRRLSLSCQRQGRSLRECAPSLLAFDLSAEAVAASRKRAESVLIDCGWD